MGQLSTQSICEKIRAEVKSRNITQAELGKMADIHQSQVSRILRGEFRRPSTNVIKVCKSLGISLKPDERTENSLPLTDAIHSIWDGTKSGEASLIRLLRALGDFTG